MNKILGGLFKQSPKKKIVLGILVMFVATIVIIIQRNEKEILNIENQKESVFALYIDGEKSTHLPSKEEKLVFDEEKSSCNNGVSIQWSYLLWTANIEFQNYELQNKEKTRCNLYFKKEEYTFDYTGSEQKFVIPTNGYYHIELWGASGGEAQDGSAQGGYVSGVLKLNRDDLIYVYVGESGTLGTNGVGNTNLGVGAPATFNGGGGGGLPGGSSVHPASQYRGGSSGGGATDIRLVNGLWNDFNSLKSRIMVAGAGGGNNGNLTYSTENISGGNNLGLKGEIGATAELFPNNGGIGATQASGYAFGYGQVGENTGLSTACNGHSGGGGGYYGGFGGVSTGGQCYITGGGGGSSFISGHNGCDAIKEESTSNNIIHTGEPNHYSGYTFTNTKMIDGMGYAWTDTQQGHESMPKPQGGYYDIGVGHTGNGYARITYLGK